MESYITPVTTITTIASVSIHGLSIPTVATIEEPGATRASSGLGLASITTLGSSATCAALCSYGYEDARCHKPVTTITTITPLASTSSDGEGVAALAALDPAIAATTPSST